MPRSKIVWRPAQRIRFAASAGRAPSAAEAAASRLYSPIDIGPVLMAQRTWVPAMVPWRATEEGYVTEEVVEWYERFARGMPGAIGNLLGQRRCVGCVRMRFLPGLKRPLPVDL